MTRYLTTTPGGLGPPMKWRAALMQAIVGWLQRWTPSTMRWRRGGVAIDFGPPSNGCWLASTPGLDRVVRGTVTMSSLANGRLTGAMLPSTMSGRWWMSTVHATSLCASAAGHRSSATGWSTPPCGEVGELKSLMSDGQAGGVLATNTKLRPRKSHKSPGRWFMKCACWLQLKVKSATFNSGVDVLQTGPSPSAQRWLLRCAQGP